MDNTATRVLHAVANPIQLLKRATAYHRAPTAEFTEMHTLTARSNDDISVEQSKSRPEEATLTSTGRVTSVQRYRRRFSGWRFGVLNFAFWALAVFLVNLIVTIWGSITHKATDGVLSEGDCERIKTLNSGVHILINVLSTIMLSGSNYCMQCLSAPTRVEVDKAHAARKWLDIGVPSFRNLRHIGRRRLILWLLLGTSSIPLHLLYNSAVYASLSTNNYEIFVVDQAFVDDPECRNCTNAGPRVSSDTNTLKNLWSKSRNGSLDRLDPIDCVKDYATLVQSKRRNVLLVTANEKVDPSRFDPAVPPKPLTPGINNTNVYDLSYFWASQGLSYYQNREALDWICSGLPPVEGSPPCLGRIKEITNPSHKWMVAARCGDFCDGYLLPVDYCLSERAVPHCKLRFNPVIAIIVTVLNVFKAVLMFCVVYFAKEDPLMTMGDAIASFLDERDVVTKGIGLLSRHDFKKGYSTGATTWRDSSWRWKDATSKKRRTVTIILFTTTTIIVVALLIWGTREINQFASIDASAVFELGFGAVDPRALISSESFPTDMASLALIANFPQIILSFLYFAYNGLFTAMLMGYEWTSYAYKKKGLRISRKPSGSQRSTYFLQLPYRFGLPLIVLSGTLHWLVSQSIFVVAFDIYDQQGHAVHGDFGWEDDVLTKTCGYSPIAMLTVVVLGVAMVAGVVISGYIPYKRSMPLAGSCSLAISAACHPEEYGAVEDLALSEQELTWGVVSTSADGIGHCAFSNQEPRPLVKGRVYA